MLMTSLTFDFFSHADEEDENDSDAGDWAINTTAELHPGKRKYGAMLSDFRHFPTLNSAIITIF